MQQTTIDPSKQTVQSCLKGKTYYIDFYQREYVWNEDTVRVLLRDIFYAFDLSYEQYKDEDLTQEVLEKYNWYYLNIFITNNINGKIYIVDGQQRLSTLTLIAVKLYHLAKNEALKGILKDCIYGSDAWKGNVYRLDNDKRKSVMECVMNGTDAPEVFKNKTEETIIKRYAFISKFFDEKAMDEKRLNTFTHYFLERLVLVELGITKDDTPMIFEVINDRGEALKPFEILKGKLVGALSKQDTEAHSEKWDIAINRLTGIEDDFFTDYLKSRFISKRNSKQESVINNQYHRYIFENNDIADALGFRKQDKNQIANIKDFISHDLEYYSKLYSKIRRNGNIYLQYNNTALQLSSPYIIILAACMVDDPEEDKKIEAIAREYERMYVMLRLNGAYDSNSLMEISYGLNEKVRGLAVDDYRRVFDDTILSTIKASRDQANRTTIFDYQSFLRANYSNQETRFLRYLLSRVEQFLCTNTNQQMQNDVFYITTKTGAKTGYHIEHILSHNETNAGYFDSEEEFENRRNQLGGLLLLKDRDNISSSNEEYSDKLKTYSAGLLWGHTLCEDFYHVNKDFESFNTRLKSDHGIEIRSIDKFDKDALDERNRLLFEIIKIIWDVQ